MAAGRHRVLDRARGRSGLTLPPLMVIAGQQGVVGLPDDAPVSVTGRDMSVAFEETGSDNTNTVYAILSNENGLGPDDEKTYQTLVDKLRQDTQQVKSVQDVLSTTGSARGIDQQGQQGLVCCRSTSLVPWARPRPARRTNNSPKHSSRPSRDPR